mmetsp:Transcript_29214/g.67018  ORF Transcript_29214/g.67018 Transcript_29214/m.67018 type:complete len:127 (-) Transcript_29214:2398-2778(-)
MLSSIINSCPVSVGGDEALAKSTEKKNAIRHTGLLPAVSGLSAFDANIILKYEALTFPEGKVLAEYVWIDASGNCRSKTRTLPANKVNINQRCWYYFLMVPHILSNLSFPLNAIGYKSRFASKMEF